MRILIIGGDGMLGHQLLATLSRHHEVRATVRRGPEAYRTFGVFSLHNTFYETDVRDSEAVRRALHPFRPDAVVNAAGIVKQRDAAKDYVDSIAVNALFPHQLALACRSVGARMVHFSTDCVFSGARGLYSERDTPDAGDLYGRSKLLGEVTEAAHCLTLRTSMVGLELSRRQGLVEWFLASAGRVKGFTRAVFSGFTTQELARIVERILVQHGDLSGLWHVSAEPIDKYRLLTSLAGALGRRGVEIEPDAALACDRSLDSTPFRQRTGYEPPSWDTMLAELANAVRERREWR
jgi:dTDP-4-dehydrorhamnose reductase